MLINFRLLFIISLCGLNIAASAEEYDPSTKLAIQLFDLTRMNSLYKNLESSATARFEKEFEPDAECDSAKLIVNRYSEILSKKIVDSMRTEDFKVDAAAAYSEVYTADELRALIELYSSPLGKKVLEKNPQIEEKIESIAKKHVDLIRPEYKPIIVEYYKAVKDPSVCSVAK